MRESSTEGKVLAVIVSPFLAAATLVLVSPLIVVVGVLHAWGLWLTWGWHVAPLGVRALSFRECVGLVAAGAVVKVCFGSMPKTETEKKSAGNAALDIWARIMSLLMAIAVAWAAKLVLR